MEVKCRKKGKRWKCGKGGFLVPRLCLGTHGLAGSACRLDKTRGRASHTVRSQAEPGNENQPPNSRGTPVPKEGEALEMWERRDYGVLLPNKVVVVFVGADPVPDVIVAVRQVDGAIAPGDMNSPTAIPMAPLLGIFQRVMSEGRMVRVGQELAVGFLGRLLNALRQHGQHRFELAYSDVPPNRPDSSFLRPRLFGSRPPPRLEGGPTYHGRKTLRPWSGFLELRGALTGTPLRLPPRSIFPVRKAERGDDHTASTTNGKAPRFPRPRQDRRGRDCGKPLSATLRRCD